MTAPATMRVRMDRVVTPPWGLAAGTAGDTAFVRVRTATGGRTLLESNGLALDAGDAVTTVTTGGGGYGSDIAVGATS